jgi:hypothetical protein
MTILVLLAAFFVVCQFGILVYAHTTDNFLGFKINLVFYTVSFLAFAFSFVIPVIYFIVTLGA